MSMIYIHFPQFRLTFSLITRDSSANKSSVNLSFALFFSPTHLVYQAVKVLAVAAFPGLEHGRTIPSFKEGRMLWFTDMSAPDSTYILPISMVLTCVFLCMDILASFNKILPLAIISLTIAWTAALPKDMVRVSKAGASNLITDLPMPHLTRARAT